MSDLEDLDFPAPHSHLTPEQLNAAWNAEWARIRAWRYELDRIWASNPCADFNWVLERKIALGTMILESMAITLELEDALATARTVKPTDVPQPWGGAG